MIWPCPIFWTTKHNHVFSSIYWHFVCVKMRILWFSFKRANHNNLLFSHFSSYLIKISKKYFRNPFWIWTLKYFGEIPCTKIEQWTYNPLSNCIPFSWEKTSCRLNQENSKIMWFWHVIKSKKKYLYTQIFFYQWKNICRTSFGNMQVP